MRRRSFLLVLVLATLLTSSSLLVGESGATRPGRQGFLTKTRPYLVRMEHGVVIEPLLTTGDILGRTQTGYQMSGVPDGLGAYQRPDGTIELFMNHELNARFDPSGARVSHLTLDNDGRVLSGSYPIDGSENFEWFCSSTLTVLGGVPWYTTGEESANSRHGGTSIALNAATGRWVETPQFGRMSHENVVPVTGLSRAYLGLSEDAFHHSSAQLYSYQAPRFTAAFRGQGTLRVWVPDRRVPDGNPSSDDIHKGDTIRGHFERIARRDNFDSETLEKAAQRKGAFDFTRIEDQTADPNHPGVVYFSETGAANREVTHGRVYRLRIDPHDPTKARLQVVLDAAAGDDIFNPDNLGISDKALIIQEDRNWKSTGYNRVLVYDLSTGSLTAAARTAPTQKVIDEHGIADWESSGVVDASSYFGPGWWFLDVQAHHAKVPVPGPSLEVNSAKGEGGQLLKIFIPGT